MPKHLQVIKKKIHYNPTWQHCKAKINTNLKEELGQRLYAQRKIDIKIVFRRMKRDFGMRRVHGKGKQAVATELGFVLMSMNLTKLARQLRLTSLHFILKSKNTLKFCFDDKIQEYFYL